MEQDTNERKRQIAELNDNLRKRGEGGEIYVTRGIISKGNVFQEKALRKVTTFSDFNENNDPYGEHDYASMEVDGVRVLFKIDYYDCNREYASPDPSDPAVTRRVLTILLSEEN